MRKKDSLEPEVICSQPGVVNLQDDPVVVSGGFQDLQNTERGNSLGLCLEGKTQCLNCA